MMSQNIATPFAITLHLFPCPRPAGATTTHPLSGIIDRQTAVAEKSISLGMLPYDVEKGDPRVYEVSEMHATLNIPTFKLCFSFRVEFFHREVSSHSDLVQSFGPYACCLR